MSRVTGALGSSPDTLQRRFSNTWSDRVYVYWRGRWGAGYKRQTRSSTRIWARITTQQYWERGRHEPGANPSGRGQRTATSPWPEEGQRWRNRT